MRRARLPGAATCDASRAGLVVPRRVAPHEVAPRRVVPGRVGLGRVVLVALLAVVAAGCSGASSGRPVVSARPSLEGVYEFAGGNSAIDAADPYLSGVVLVYYWRQLEPSPGRYDWSLVTSQMAPWVRAHRRVILRVSTSGQAAWQPPDSGHATPGWLYRQGVRSVRDEGSTIPVYWSGSFLEHYRAFVTAFGARFDGDPDVAFVEAGIGMGGETLPDTLPDAGRLAAWRREGYSDARWLATVEELAGDYRAAFDTTPVYVMLDHTFLDRSESYYRRLLSWLRSSHPAYGLQFNGLSSTVRLPAGWPAGFAAEQEQSTSASGDRLCADLEHGIALGARYLLVFQSDIDTTSNRGCLRHIAALVAAGTAAPSP